MCAVSPVVHTSNISSCQKKLFQFSCGCEQLLLLWMFVITERTLWNALYNWKLQISWKSVQFHACKRTERQTDGHNEVNFTSCNFSAAPEVAGSPEAQKFDSHPIAVGVQRSSTFITLRVSFLKWNCPLHSLNEEFTSWLSHKVLFFRLIGKFLLNLMADQYSFQPSNPLYFNI
jgi:hypothetical protein